MSSVILVYSPDICPLQLGYDKPCQSAASGFPALDRERSQRSGMPQFVSIPLVQGVLKVSVRNGERKVTVSSFYKLEVAMK